MSKINKKGMGRDEQDQAIRDRIQEMEAVPEAWDHLSDLINVFEERDDERSRLIVSACYRAMELSAADLANAKARGDVNASSTMATKMVDQLLSIARAQFRIEPLLNAKLNMTTEDVAHEAFVRIISRPTVFEWGQRKSRPFLRTCVDNIIKDILRSEASGKRRAHALDADKKASNALGKKALASIADLKEREFEHARKTYKDAAAGDIPEGDDENS